MGQYSTILSRLKINGSFYLCNFSTAYTVLDLLTYLGFNKNVVVIDYNGSILEKVRWSKVQLQHNDSLEILSIAGGG